jgi:hypothetical protein
MRTSPPITITDEIPGDEYTDLEAAQRAALPLLVDNLASVIRDLLARGILVIRDGKIIPNPERLKNE